MTINQYQYYRISQHGSVFSLCRHQFPILVVHHALSDCRAQDRSMTDVCENFSVVVVSVFTLTVIH